MIKTGLFPGRYIQGPDAMLRGQRRDQTLRGQGVRDCGSVHLRQHPAFSGRGDRQGHLPGDRGVQGRVLRRRDPAPEGEGEGCGRDRRHRRGQDPGYGQGGGVLPEGAGGGGAQPGIHGCALQRAVGHLHAERGVREISRPAPEPQLRYRGHENRGRRAGKIPCGGDGRCAGHLLRGGQLQAELCEQHDRRSGPHDLVLPGGAVPEHPPRERRDGHARLRV